MKKLKILGLVSLFCVSFVFAQVKVQVQGAVIGAGYGLGAGMTVIPLLLDVGLEGMSYTSPAFESKGNYKDENTNVEVPYEGEIKLISSRAGAYLAFKLPGVSLIPCVGILANPTVHFGTQHLKISVDGSVNPFDQKSSFSEDVTGEGSYVLLGFPNYIGPVFIEPAIGAQHIAIKGVGSFSNLPEAQLTIGLSF